MSSPPITAVPRPLVLRKAKSYAIQSSVDLMAGSPKQSRGIFNDFCELNDSVAGLLTSSSYRNRQYTLQILQKRCLYSRYKIVSYVEPDVNIY